MYSNLNLVDALQGLCEMTVETLIDDLLTLWDPTSSDQEAIPGPTSGEMVKNGQLLFRPPPGLELKGHQSISPFHSLVFEGDRDCGEEENFLPASPCFNDMSYEEEKEEVEEVGAVWNSGDQGQRRTCLRPCKGKRARYKKLKLRLSQMIEADPYGFDFDAVELPDHVAKDSLSKEKLKVKILAEVQEARSRSQLQTERPAPRNMMAHPLGLVQNGLALEDYLGLARNGLAQNNLALKDYLNTYGSIKTSDTSNTDLTIGCGDPNVFFLDSSGGSQKPASRIESNPESWDRRVSPQDQPVPLSDNMISKVWHLQQALWHFQQAV